MQIPAHQIYNVLDAYTRGLAKQQACRNGDIAGADDADDDTGFSDSAQAKRRVIIDKISTVIIENITRSGTGPRIITTAPHPPEANPEADPETEAIRYNRITATGKKIFTAMKIQDSDFLLRNLRKSDETEKDPEKT